MLSAEGVSAWQTILEHIERKITPQQYATWFRNLRLEQMTEESVTMSVPSSFHRDWIVTYYRGMLEQAVNEAFAQRRAVTVVVAQRETVPPGQKPRTTDEGAASGRLPHPGPAIAPPPREAESPSHAGLVLTDGMDLEHWVQGPDNELAGAAGRSLATAPSSDFQTMLVLGSTGVGKTHLLQAVARLARAERPKSQRVGYLRAETFVNDFVQAVGTGDCSRFRERYRNLDFVCFDDLQVLSGKDHTQQEFLHTFTAWLDRGARVVLAARCAPGDNLDIDGQLLGQLTGAFRVTLSQPEFETRKRLVQMKAEARGEVLPADVVTFLADLPTTSVRELEGAVTSVIASSRLTGVPVTLPLARKTLHHDSFAHRPASSPERVLSMVCRHFDVKLTDLTSPRRPQALSFARQVAMFLLRERTELSLSEIGSSLGGRDHTTILHGIRKIEQSVEMDVRLREHLTRIRSLLDR